MTSGAEKADGGVAPIVGMEGLFPAAPGRVYRAWTEPEQLKRWFGKGGALAAAEVDLRIGGAWRFTFHDDETGRSFLEGEYLAIEPEARLAFTWRHVSVKPDGARQETGISTVTVLFEAEGAATRVRLRHEGILTEDGRKGVSSGWTAALQSLEALLEA